MEDSPDPQKPSSTSPPSAGNTPPERSPASDKTSQRPQPDSRSAAGGTDTGNPFSGSGNAEPDDATSRWVWLDENERLFVDGDAVYGDKNVFHLGGSGGITLQRIPSYVEEPARRAFVAPINWDDLGLHGRERRAAIFVAPRRSGRTTIAIKLLIDSGNVPIWLLDHRIKPERLCDRLEQDVGRHDEDLPADSGFLLCDPAAPEWLNGRELQRLEDLLERAGYRLIIVVGADARPTDDTGLDHQLPTPGPVDPRAVLEAHVRWRMGSRAEALLSDDKVLRAIDGWVDSGLTLKQAAHLAVLIESREKDGKVDLAEITSLLARREDDEFSIWLDRLIDGGDTGFAVALAVLDGLPFEHVLAAAKALDTKLGRSDPPRSGYRDRFDAFRAQKCRSFARNQAFGRTVEDSVEYAYAGYPKRVIEHAWQRTGRSDVILEWLLELAEKSSTRVRIRAAGALGLLSSTNFDYLHDAVLGPWASAENTARRDTVAYALRSTLSGNVGQLIDQWHGGLFADNRTRATAARAYGVSLPDADLGFLLDRLGRLAVVADDAVQFSVGVSLADLIARDPVRSAGQVLQALCEWTPNHRRESAVVMGFLLAAYSLKTEPNEDRAGGTSSSWPLLLLLADQNHHLRGYLCTLWTFVLQSWRQPGTYHFTVRILEEWAALAEADPQVRRAFVRLLGALAWTSERMAGIVRQIVAEWAGPDHLRALSLTAEAASQHLDSPDQPAHILELLP